MNIYSRVGQDLAWITGTKRVHPPPRIQLYELLAEWQGAGLQNQMREFDSLMVLIDIMYEARAGIEVDIYIWDSRGT